ncbi:MAG: DUF3500 domain-containing protein [Deltaproteobacteria bacterium]|nr:DUF3500 domain-containing protein [Deltaproteobacteria bacterium]
MRMSGVIPHRGWFVSPHRGWLALGLVGLMGFFATALSAAWVIARGPAGPAAAMAKAADNFVAALSAEEKARAVFAFDVPGRTEWHFIPKDRTGLPIKAMSPQQRTLAHALLKTGLSVPGYAKAKLIMTLETVLRDMEKDPIKRDPEKYWFSVFGTPTPAGNWGWKVEGHHISLNFTIVNGHLVATSPSFLGANPGEVREGPMKGTRALGTEEDEGRKFLMSLSDELRAKAIFDQTAPPEIVTGPASEVKPLPEVGISAASLDAKHKSTLVALLGVFAGTLNPALAAERLAKVKAAGADKLRFGWAGGIKRGDPHYYRISGPTFLVEYDNTQNGANHVHTIWRDFNGDFGRDLLREHLNNAHP